jgi:hypothetical protein
LSDEELKEMAKKILVKLAWWSLQNE